MEEARSLPLCRECGGGAAGTPVRVREGEGGERPRETGFDIALWRMGRELLGNWGAAGGPEWSGP